MVYTQNSLEKVFYTFEIVIISMLIQKKQGLKIKLLSTLESCTCIHFSYC